MTPEQFQSLGAGDIVRHRLRADSFLVTANYGGRVTAVNSVDITNAQEWSLVAKASHTTPQDGQ